MTRRTLFSNEGEIISLN